MSLENPEIEGEGSQEPEEIVDNTQNEENPESEEALNSPTAGEKTNPASITDLTEEEKRKRREEKFGPVKKNSPTAKATWEPKSAQAPDIQEKIKKLKEKRLQQMYIGRTPKDLQNEIDEIKKRQDRYGQTEESKSKIEQLTEAIQLIEQNKGNPEFEMSALFTPLPNDSKRLYQIKKKKNEKWHQRRDKDKNKESGGPKKVEWWKKA
ncbi:unnamed protein product [Moneuplotes crassus]|uniref:Uncharacterized protein n=1 Tax=Euplotes crassus TaxID=5936 RepID=A0AAD1XRV0_EUPCR|nr:unnamed protein product [Moneuplotes crassus]